MENCTIYSHHLAFDKIAAIVKTHLPKAYIEQKEDGLQKSLTATVKGGFFSKPKVLQINCRQRLNPSYKLVKIECELTQNLSGMANFVQGLPAANPEIRNKFLHKLTSANIEMPFMAQPEITKEFAAILKDILVTLEAFAFVQASNFFNASQEQHFLDQNLELILDTNGNCNITELDVKVDAKYHDAPAEQYTQDQLDRKSRSEQMLSENKVKTNKNLPCLEDPSTTSLRRKEDVVGRAYALLIMSVKGEGIEQEHLERTIKEKNINSLTDQEQAIFEKLELSDHERSHAAWRYESLTTLLWALGVIEDLPYPSEICDVKKVVTSIFHPSREEFEQSANLRSTSEILDELDKTYRMNWACVDARIKGQEVTGRLNPSVVYERHYALNWLTKYQDQEWDDVQTNT